MSGLPTRPEESDRSRSEGISGVALTSAGVCGPCAVCRAPGGDQRQPHPPGAHGPLRARTRVFQASVGCGAIWGLISWCFRMLKLFCDPRARSRSPSRSPQNPEGGEKPEQLSPSSHRVAPSPSGCPRASQLAGCCPLSPGPHRPPLGSSPPVGGHSHASGAAHGREDPVSAALGLRGDSESPRHRPQPRTPRCEMGGWRLPWLSGAWRASLPCSFQNRAWHISAPQTYACFPLCGNITKYGKCPSRGPHGCIDSIQVSVLQGRLCFSLCFYPFLTLTILG